MPADRSLPDRQVVPTTVILEYKSEHVIAWTQPAVSKEVPPCAVGDQIGLPVGIVCRSYLDRFAPVATVTDVTWAFNHHIVTLEAAESCSTASESPSPEPPAGAPIVAPPTAPSVAKTPASIETPPVAVLVECAPTPARSVRSGNTADAEQQRPSLSASKASVPLRRKSGFRRMLVRALQRSAQWRG